MKQGADKACNGFSSQDHHQKDQQGQGCIVLVP